MATLSSCSPDPPRWAEAAGNTADWRREGELGVLPVRREREGDGVRSGEKNGGG